MTSSTPAPEATATPDTAPTNLWWIATARTVSLVGTSLTSVAIPLLAYRLTGSALFAAAMFAANGLTYLALGIAAGEFADRFNTKKILIVCDVARAVALLAIPVAHLAGALSGPLVAAVVFTNSVLFVFADAAQAPFLNFAVGKQRIERSQVILLTLTSLAEVASPVLATGLLLIMSPAQLFAVDAATFVLSALLLSRVWLRVRATPMRAFRLSLSSVGAGAAALWSRSSLRVATAVAIASAFTQGGVIGQMVVLIDERFGQGEARLGIFFAAISLGSLPGTWTAPIARRRLSTTTASVGAGLVAAATALAITIATSWVVLVVLTAIWAWAAMWVLLIALLERQLTVEPELLGRANACARMSALGIAIPTGSLLGGIITTQTSARTSMQVICGLAGLATVGIAVAATRTRARRTGKDVPTPAGNRDKEAVHDSH